MLSIFQRTCFNIFYRAGVNIAQEDFIENFLLVLNYCNRHIEKI
jgi:hypothetical protein